ncbi:hypothetical protein ABT294_01615 [Nonomuraea sp. NPDC000554]|uniref:hypothetical protein n=1 Tax=Nonomuraea sp. NPDC000554 TaxID=3154259 RepID=UPI0033231F23
MRIGTRLALAALPVGATLLLPSAAWAWPQPDNPGDPFTMSTDRVACGRGRVGVNLTNDSGEVASYDLQSDSQTVATGSIEAHDTITRNIRVGRGSSVRVEAFSVDEDEADSLIDSTLIRNDCPWGRRFDQPPYAGGTWGRRSGRLPYTGPPADLWGKLATAGGLVITGGIIWWYGSIWPRQTYS